MRMMPYIFTFILMACVSACAAPEQHPLAETTQDASLSTSHYTAPDGQTLPLSMWLPKGKSDAIILALHGFNDYSQAFALPGTFLASQNVALIAYDQRGFGRNESHRGIWAGRDHLVNDVAQTLRLIKQGNPDVPLYLMGESMGGAIAMLAASETEVASLIDGMILVGPAVWGDASLSVFHRFPLWLVTRTFPASEFTGEGLDVVATDNMQVLTQMAGDPNIVTSTRADAIYGLVNVMDETHLAAPDISVPTLLLYGQKDQIIPADSIQRVRPLFNQSEVTYKEYPEGYHMLLRDHQRQNVYNDMMAWLIGVREEKVSDASSAESIAPLR